MAIANEAVSQLLHNSTLHAIPNRDYNNRAVIIEAIRASHLEKKETGWRNALNLQMALKAVDDEPEYPGEMPDEMWAAIRNDRDAMAFALRNTVTLTKKGIKNRLSKFLQDARAASDGKEQGAPAREENPFSVDDEYAYFDGPAAKGFEPKRTTDEYYDCLAHEWRQCGALTNGLAFLPWVKYRRRTGKFPSVLSGSKSDNAAGVSSPSPSSSSPATVREQMEEAARRLVEAWDRQRDESLDPHDPEPGDRANEALNAFLKAARKFFAVPSGIVEQPKKDSEEKETVTRNTADRQTEKALERPNGAFRAWVETLPDAYWARYDLSACRLGWEARSTHDRHNTHCELAVARIVCCALEAQGGSVDEKVDAALSAWSDFLNGRSVVLDGQPESVTGVSLKESSAPLLDNGEEKETDLGEKEA